MIQPGKNDTYTWLDCPDKTDVGMCCAIYHDRKRMYGNCDCQMKKGICKKGYAR